MFLRRRPDLITEPMGEEALVLDPRTGAIHGLKPVAARLWAACDGRCSLEALHAARGDATSAEGEAALRDLFSRGLIEPASEGSTSRRQFLRGVGAVPVAFGGAAVTTLIPSTAQAASCAQLLKPCGAGCCQGLMCSIGLCVLKVGPSPGADPRRGPR